MSEVALPTAIATINGKGGSGKTSLCANLAALAATAGYMTLAIDLDPQGNLRRDLGYREDPADGDKLFAALQGHAPLNVLSNVRPGLDVVPAHGGLRLWNTLANGIRTQNRTAPETALLRALSPIAGNYHLIIIDCPPGEFELQLLAVTTAQHLLVPTRADDAGVDGLLRISELLDQVRDHNPRGGVLGVALFDVGTGSIAVHREVREVIDGLLGEGAMFDTFIRHLDRAGWDVRRRGQLAHEYEADVAAAPRFYEDSGRHVRLSRSAPGLAGDYANLTVEILNRFAGARDQVSA